MMALRQWRQPWRVAAVVLYPRLPRLAFPPPLLRNRAGRVLLRLLHAALARRRLGRSNRFGRQRRRRRPRLVRLATAILVSGGKRLRGSCQLRRQLRIGF